MQAMRPNKNKQELSCCRKKASCLMRFGIQTSLVTQNYTTTCKNYHRVLPLYSCTVQFRDRDRCHQIGVHAIAGTMPKMIIMSVAVWVVYPESVGLFARVAVISNQCKAVISGNAISDLCSYNSGLRTNFHVVTTIVVIQLNTQTTTLTTGHTSL